MSAIVRTEAAVIQEIEQLHSEIGSILKKAVQESLPKAIRIGELLSEQKIALPHGEFTPWVEKNLSIGKRQAQRYMKVYNNRMLLSDYHGDFTSAIKFLSAPKDEKSDINDVFEENISSTTQESLNDTTSYSFSKLEQKRIQKYIERDGLTKEQAERIVANDHHEREEKKRKAAERKAAQELKRTSFSLRVPSELHKRAEQVASQRGVSLAELLTELLNKL